MAGAGGARAAAAALVVAVGTVLAAEEAAGLVGAVEDEARGGAGEEGGWTGVEGSGVDWMGAAAASGMGLAVAGWVGASWGVEIGMGEILAAAGSAEAD